MQNKYAVVQDVANAASGALSTGALSGGATGNVGVGVGMGLASAGAGVADIIINNKLREDQLNKTKDLFNYNLQNIQALPYSLSKSSSFNINSKYVPFLEFYTCTEEEKNALLNKIK